MEEVEINDNPNSITLDEAANLLGDASILAVYLKGIRDALEKHKNNDAIKGSRFKAMKNAVKTATSAEQMRDQLSKLNAEIFWRLPRVTHNDIQVAYRALSVDQLKAIDNMLPGLRRAQDAPSSSAQPKVVEKQVVVRDDKRIKELEAEVRALKNPPVATQQGNAASEPLVREVVRQVEVIKEVKVADTALVKGLESQVEQLRKELAAASSPSVKPSRAPNAQPPSTSPSPELAQITAENKKLLADITQLRKEIEGKINSVESLNTQLREQEQLHVKLVQEKDSANATVATLRSEAVHASTQIVELDAQIKAKEVENNDLKQNSLQLQATLQITAAQKQQLQEQNKLLNGRNADLLSLNLEYKEQNQEYEDEIQQLQEIIEQQKQLLVEFAKTLEKYQSQVQRTVATLFSMYRRVVGYFSDALGKNDSEATVQQQGTPSPAGPAGKKETSGRAGIFGTLRNVATKAKDAQQAKQAQQSTQKQAKAFRDTARAKLVEDGSEMNLVILRSTDPETNQSVKQLMSQLEALENEFKILFSTHDKLIKEVDSIKELSAEKKSSKPVLAVEDDTPPPPPPVDTSDFESVASSDLPPEVPAFDNVEGAKFRAEMNTSMGNSASSAPVTSSSASAPLAPKAPAFVPAPPVGLAPKAASAPKKQSAVAVRSTTQAAPQNLSMAEMVVLERQKREAKAKTQGLTLAEKIEQSRKEAEVAKAAAGGSQQKEGLWAGMAANVDAMNALVQKRFANTQQSDGEGNEFSSDEDSSLAK